MAKAKSGPKKPRTPAQIAAQEKNLKKIQPGEMAREYNRRAQEARMRNKTMAETMIRLLALPLRGDETVAELQSLADATVTKGTKKKAANVSVAEAILLAQVKEALNGNTQAAKFIRELIPDATTTEQADDGFLEALNGTAAADWEGGDDDAD